jgi:hypothetical protein
METQSEIRIFLQSKNFQKKITGIQKILFGIENIERCISDCISMGDVLPKSYKTDHEKYIKLAQVRFKELVQECAKNFSQTQDEARGSLVKIFHEQKITLPDFLTKQNIK